MNKKDIYRKYLFQQKIFNNCLIVGFLFHNYVYEYKPWETILINTKKIVSQIIKKANNKYLKNSNKQKIKELNTKTIVYNKVTSETVKLKLKTQTKIFNKKIVTCSQ